MNVTIFSCGPGSILTEPQVYGRDKEEDEIVKILKNYVSDAQQLPVLPILGMGGLGKTTLAQMVFNDQRVIQHFDPKIWVCVSDNFEEKRLIKAIVESAEGRPLLGDVEYHEEDDVSTRRWLPSLRKLSICNLV
ncbi:hypothetical protein KY290_034385 [Solanum tuberosum]|uniref:NB-ARC domain-containing protein n=1 Tax=Solanum tuberosum TaxID=4113 RepID=A0ABQ7U328_SOLTU|nr:hypothetical protein KY284_033485 [Solanum tuberosum]KAH0741342.1 hypothetical protein KY290_034385 [Solanum tuberosum]